nr:uncharacterized protein LOC122321696 [Drosophila bipectinata]
MKPPSMNRNSTATATTAAPHNAKGPGRRSQWLGVVVANWEPGRWLLVTGNCGYTYNPPSAKAPTEIMTAGEITIKAKTPAEGRAKTQVKDNIDAPFPHNGER